MSDPSLPMQAAIVARLKAVVAVTAIVGSGASARIYDDVPMAAAKPYISIGQPQILPDKASCLDGAEVSWAIHGWTAGPKSQGVRELAAAILSALDEHDLVVTGHRVILFEHEQTQTLEDPDGLTKHVVCVFRALTEPV